MKAPSLLEEGFKILGITTLVDEVYKADSIDSAKAKLELLKDTARRQFKKVALNCHPDRTQNDKEKTRIFISASNAVDYIVKKWHLDPLQYKTKNKSKPKNQVIRKVEPMPPIDWNRIPYNLRGYYKWMEGHNPIVCYCYFFCTPRTCTHGFFK